MLKNRIITGVLVSSFFLGMVLFAPVWMLVVLMCAVYFLAQLEYCEMCEKSGYKLERVGIFVCGFLFLGATLFEINPPTAMCFSVFGSDPMWEWTNTSTPYLHSPTQVLLYLIPAFFVIQSVLRRKTERAAECLGLSLLGFWYVAVLISFMVRIALSHDEIYFVVGNLPHITYGRLLLICFIVLVKMSDIGAYTFGSLWGHKFKRKLIPEISPAKSFPGLLGAYVGSALGAIVIFSFVCLGKPPSWHVGVILIALAILMATVGVLGDLVESLLKRSFGVKDSSSRFPGMGGFLDILDSLLFAAPFMYFFVLWFM